MANGRWDLLSSHGAVLFFIAAHPNTTRQEIADSMLLTSRTVWRLVSDLRRAKMIHVRREGRRYRFRVNLDADFRHPVLNSMRLRDVLGPIAAGVSAGVPSRRAAPERELVPAGLLSGRRSSVS